MRRTGLLASLFVLVCAFALASRAPVRDARLRGALRRQTNGWIFVHLHGSPSQIGFQHGYLLAPEIAEAQKIMALLLKRDTDRDWAFFRNAAQTVLWPHVEEQYRQELEGIAQGLNARGVKLDALDVTTMNAWQELSPYWYGWYEKQQNTAWNRTSAPERCSAFVATGSWTKDGKVVIGHNAWTGYLEGERWNIVFDIVPSRGHRILMDGFPGLIHSADDFGMNSSGILITETTITQFSGFDPNGIPEFVRARKAMQYSSSLDDFARIMTQGNNGGYANNWLAADRKTNEIASLELGLKNVTFSRKKDGYFVGANFPVNEKLAREETKFDLTDPGLSPNARRVRWEQLMAGYKGRIDVAAAERFLSDHYDTVEKKEQASERTLCGHNEVSPRGMKPWQAEFAPAGAVQAKAADARMAERMAFVAAMGHPCGVHFKAAAHLRQHPEFVWQKEFLRDMNSNPWTEFRAQDLNRR